MASKSWKFAETSHATTVGLNKTDVKFQKELANLERQQNTAMNNIANYQQAMKMSWRRLEERRAESPTLSKKIDQGDNKKQKKGLLLQSNTKLYVNRTPSIYNPTSQPGGEIAAKDDSVLESTCELTSLYWLSVSMNFLICVLSCSFLFCSYTSSRSQRTTSHCLE